MKNREFERLSLMLSIIERGKGKAFIERMRKKGITFHLQTVGHGTAPSEMMDLFGLSNSDKDVVVSMAPKRTIDLMAAETDKGPDSIQEFRGLTIILSPSAVNRLTAAVLSRSTATHHEKEEATDVEKSENKYELILMSFNHGFSDQVMQCAKAAGATGGTVIRGRLAGAGEFEQFTDIHMDEEKEIIAILAPSGISGRIMDSVNREYGLTTEAGGIVCSVSVERAFKI